MVRLPRRALRAVLPMLIVGCGAAPDLGDATLTHHGAVGEHAAVDAAGLGSRGEGSVGENSPNLPSPSAAPVEATGAPAARATASDLLRWAAVLDGEQRRDAQRVLRSALAGDDPRAAVLACELLTQHYVAREAFGDALAVVEAGLANSAGSAELHYAHGLVLRDVGQFDRAREALLRALTANPADHSATLVLAELEVAGGDAAAARERLIAVLGRHGDDPWVDERRTQIAALAEHARLVARGEAAPQIGLALELGLMRGSPDAARRRTALQRMLSQPSHRLAALRAALAGSAGTTIQILALRALTQDDAASEACGVLLEHHDPLVRGAAARAAARLDVAIELLLDRLDAEEDGYAFRSLHVALTERLGARVSLRQAGEDDPDLRRATRTSWRQTWNP